MARSREPLDERLVQVTFELLAEEGPAALTLRRIARRAGVSHGAPHRHFRSLAPLGLRQHGRSNAFLLRLGIHGIGRPGYR